MPKTTFADKGDRADVHTTITQQFIQAMEQCVGEYRCPWHSKGSALHLPRNIASGKTYQGVNVLALWGAGIVKGYQAGTWGTYKQWASVGAQVQKGEKSSTVVFYKELDPGEKGDDESDDKRSSRRFVAKASAVFAVEQTDAYTPFFMDDKPAQTEIMVEAEDLIKATGAMIKHEGNRAFYHLSTDQITLPPRGFFLGTETMTPVESYFATAFHELGHWSGAPHRLNRDFGKRFGDNKYAFEEILVDIGSAFLCAEMGVCSELRPDHVQYVSHWMKILKADSQAIFLAAAGAQKVSTYLRSFSKSAPTREAGETDSFSKRISTLVDPA